MTAASERALARAKSLVVIDGGGHRLTDLTCTSLDGVQGRTFRLFTPIKPERNRLPTSLPEFRSAALTGNLSDSPLYAAAHLGGTWRDHNLAAICHVAACNLRCSYCYVDYSHLAGHDAFEADAVAIVDDFIDLRRRVGSLTILRVSGGEPLLAPGLIADIFDELGRRGELERVVLKFETNLTPLGTTDPSADTEVERLRGLSGQVAVHATIHFAPGAAPEWNLIRAGLARALDLGLDLFPAIGAADWNRADLENLFEHLHALHPALPARLAVRPFQLDYDVVRARDRAGSVGEDRTSVGLWDELLWERLGRRYLEMPRHLVELT